MYVLIGKRIDDENKQIPAPDRMKSFMTQGSSSTSHQGSVSEKKSATHGGKILTGALKSLESRHENTF
jgi:hypothetical protein